MAMEHKHVLNHANILTNNSNFMENYIWRAQKSFLSVVECFFDVSLFFQFVAKFTRRFIADDESVSVITDVEDDDDGHGVASGLSTLTKNY